MSWFRAASKASAGAADTAEGAEAAARAKIGTLPVRSDQIPRAHGDMQAHIEQEMAMEHAPARKEYTPEYCTSVGNDRVNQAYVL